VWEFLTIHRKASCQLIAQNFIFFATAPQPPPFKNVTALSKQLFGGGDVLFVRYTKLFANDPLLASHWNTSPESSPFLFCSHI
jgi:hypothetical protein